MSARLLARCVLGALLVAAATTVGLGASARPASAAYCAPVLLYSARGSGESIDANAGLGGPGWVLADSLAQRVSGIFHVADPYAAIPWWEYAGGPNGNYFHSRSYGASLAVRWMSNIAAQCRSSKVV